MLRRLSLKQAVVIVLSIVIPAVAYLFRASIIDFFVLRPTSPEYEVEILLVDETPEYNLQINPLHPQDFKTFFLGYFFTENIERVFLHLTNQPQDVSEVWEGSGGKTVTYSGHSNDFPADGEYHVYVYLNQAALEEAQWSPQMVARHAESLFYQAIFIISSHSENSERLALDLLNKSDLNLLLIGNE